MFAIKFNSEARCFIVIQENNLSNKILFIISHLSESMSHTKMWSPLNGIQLIIPCIQIVKNTKRTHIHVLPFCPLPLWLCGSRQQIISALSCFGAHKLLQVWDWALHVADRTQAPYLAVPVFSQLTIPFFFSLTIVFQAALGFHSSHIRTETFILKMASVVNFSIT